MIYLIKNLGQYQQKYQQGYCQYPVEIDTYPINTLADITRKQQYSPSWRTLHPGYCSKSVTSFSQRIDADSYALNSA